MEELKEEDRQKIIVDSPIYTEYDKSNCDKKKLGEILMRGSVESYCPKCKKVSIFKVKTPSFNFSEEVEKQIPSTGVFVVAAGCMQDSAGQYSSHCGYEMNVCFRIEYDKVIKIGQYPSRADIDFSSLDKAFGELSKAQRKELGTAIGLFSHGIGIGSFVYLRRIFEGLIDEAHEKAIKESDLKDEEYIKLRMNEKIIRLKEYLPSRLVRTANLYGILSQGIHELTEEECKEKFPLVKQAIQYILSEQLEEREYEAVSRLLEK